MRLPGDRVGTSHSRRAGGTAGAHRPRRQTSSSSSRWQVRPPHVTGERACSWCSQLVYAAQDASAYATTTQQAGSSALSLGTERGRRAEPSSCRARRQRRAPSARWASISQEVAQESIAVQLGDGLVDLEWWDRRLRRGRQLRDRGEQGATQSLEFAGSALVGEQRSETDSARPPRRPWSRRRRRRCPPVGTCFMTLASREISRPARCRMDQQPTGIDGRARLPAAAEREPPGRPRDDSPGARPGSAPRAASHGATRSRGGGAPSFPPCHSTQARLDTRPGATRGRRRRSGAAAPAGGRPANVGLRARGRSVRRGARGDRSDPPRLRAGATAPAARARRVGRQATDRRPRPDRRPGLTFRHAM